MPIEPRTHALELMIPPGVLVLFIALLMWLGSAVAPIFRIPVPLQATTAWIFVVLGIAAAGLGFVEFKRARTTVNPLKPGSSSTLVTRGVYRRTRNPMYLGFLLVLVGVAVATANLLAVLLLPAFVLYMNRFQIKPEERALSAMFGAQFENYCAKVRRWI
jgi:protein-S-isoprenylcysteine O-methyltransferase Ste14